MAELAEQNAKLKERIAELGPRLRGNGLARRVTHAITAIDDVLGSTRGGRMFEPVTVIFPHSDDEFPTADDLRDFLRHIAPSAKGKIPIKKSGF